MNSIEIQENEAQTLTTLDVFKTVWRGRALIIRSIIAMLVLAFIVLIVTKPQYSGYVIVAPSNFSEEESSNFPSSLGGIAPLASLANISMGTTTPNSFVYFRESLKSVAVAENVQRMSTIMTVIFADSWDAEKEQWSEPIGTLTPLKRLIKVIFGRPAWQEPDARALSQYITEEVKIREAADGAMLRIEFSNSDPVLIGRLLGDIYKGADSLIRSEALKLSKARRDYITRQLLNTTATEQKDILIALLSQEITTQMLAEADEFYSIQVIEPTVVSAQPTWPSISLVALLFVVLGGIIGLMLVVAYVAVEREFPTFTFYQKKK